MYNPYLEEETFVPLEETIEPVFNPSEISNMNPETEQQITAMLNSPIAAAVMEEVTSDGKLTSLKKLVKLKDFASDSGILKDLGGFFGKKKQERADLEGTPSFMSKSKTDMTAMVDGQEQEGILSIMKKKLKLDHLEVGDVLLVIIVIYLMLEGDDKLELAITMGILAFLWWSDKEKEVT